LIPANSISSKSALAGRRTECKSIRVGMPRARRRGDRIATIFAAVPMSPFGTTPQARTHRPYGRYLSRHARGDGALDDCDAKILPVPTPLVPPIHRKY